MRTRALLIVLALAALVPASAQAATKCPGGFTCSNVRVPLDRAGALPGTLDLPVVAERSNKPGALLVLAGGPGQGAVGFAPQIAEGMKPMLKTRRLIAFDQRGTGATALDCPALQGAQLSDFSVPPAGSVEACAAKLGPARAHFSTAATVEDIEAVRQSLGVEKLAIYGVSYGTYVAERYARAHPDRVESLILDSVVPQENVDPLGIPRFTRLATDLRAQCAGRRCSSFTKDPVADVAALVAKLGARPVRGSAYGPGGRKIASAVPDAPALFELAVNGSVSDFIAGAFPAAVTSARAGDTAPLLRLEAVARRLNQSTAAENSWGLHAATLCSDVTFPWGPASTPLAPRGAAATAAAQAAAGQLAPFGVATGAGNGLIASCRRWEPVDVAPPPAPGPLPAVPILILAGTFDTSTPLEDARREGARSPTAQILEVPGAGHSILGRGFGCVGTAIERFAAGRKIGTCLRGESQLPVAQPRVPRRLSDVPGRGKERLELVALLSFADATGVANGLNQGTTVRWGGLRGGAVELKTDGDKGTLRLRRYTLVPGLPVTGTIDDGDGSLRVGGRSFPIRAGELVGGIRR